MPNMKSRGGKMKELKRALSKTTDLAPAIPEIRTSLIEEEFREKAIARGLAVVYKELMGKPGSSLKVPKIAGIDAIEWTEGGVINSNALTMSEVDVPVKTFETSVDITEEAIQDSFVSVIDAVTRGIGAALAEKEDKYIFQKAVDGAGAEIIAGDKASIDDLVAGDILTPKEIKDARAWLRKYKAPQPFSLVLHPEQVRELMDDDQFMDAAQYGDDSVVKTGEVGRFIGMKVFESTNLPVVQNNQGVEVYAGLALSARSIAFVPKQDIQSKEVDLAAANSLARRYLGTLRSGAEVLNPPYTVVLYSA